MFFPPFTSSSFPLIINCFLITVKRREIYQHFSIKDQRRIWAKMTGNLTFPISTAIYLFLKLKNQCIFFLVCLFIQIANQQDYYQKSKNKQTKLLIYCLIRHVKRNQNHSTSTRHQIVISS